MKALNPPAPYFGSKRAIASIVWEALGQIKSYSEPCAGMLANYLAAPYIPEHEVVNDSDCYLVNFWRAVSRKPKEVARYALHPVFEADLHARHLWLVNQREAFIDKTLTRPNFYDVKLAGLWIWGLSCWLGGEWCKATKRPPRRRPHLTTRQGVTTPLRVPSVTKRGVVALESESLVSYFRAIAWRMAHATILCGDWSRAVTPAALRRSSRKKPMTGIFFDPPYNAPSRDGRTYTNDSKTIGTDIETWCLEHESAPCMRIVLAGYEGDYPRLAHWRVVKWEGSGGYKRGDYSPDKPGATNAKLERLWLSPQCLNPMTQLSLLGESELGGGL